MEPNLIVISALFIAGVISAFFIGNRFGRNTKWGIIQDNGAHLYTFKSGDTLEETQNKVMEIVRENVFLEEQRDRHVQVEELVFLLTDLMHDPKVFNVFSNEELCDIYHDARMMTKYRGSGIASTDELKSFNQKLREMKSFPDCIQATFMIKYRDGPQNNTQNI